MKIFAFLVALFLSSNFFGQCTIAGNSVIKLNETATYSVDAKAQCEECYVWKSSSDQNLKIEGSSISNKVNVRAAGLGKNTLSVTLLNGTAETKCEKTIEVVDENQTDVKGKCGVTINDFKDVKVSETVMSFFPNENATSDYSYEWNVTYANNEVKTSTDKIPQFFFSEINYIKLVKLKVKPKDVLCVVSISKSYEQNYWKPASSQVKVEQKVYSPMSYSDYLKSSEQPKTESSDKK